jgi:hypothetical protein
MLLLQEGIDGPFDNFKKTFLSPSAGGEDEGEGVLRNSEPLTLSLSP